MIFLPKPNYSHRPVSFLRSLRVACTSPKVYSVNFCFIKLCSSQAELCSHWFGGLHSLDGWCNQTPGIWFSGRLRNTMQLVSAMRLGKPCHLRPSVGDFMTNGLSARFQSALGLDSLGFNKFSGCAMDPSILAKCNTWVNVRKHLNIFAWPFGQVGVSEPLSTLCYGNTDCQVRLYTWVSQVQIPVGHCSFLFLSNVLHLHCLCKQTLASAHL